MCISICIWNHIHLHNCDLHRLPKAQLNFNAANTFYCCQAWGNRHFEKRFNSPSIKMNLSDDTSNDSSVRVGQDNDIFAGQQDLNLSVSSNDQIGQHPHGEVDQDLVGENQRLREENYALKQRISELEEGGADREQDMKPWSELGRQWKWACTSGIVTQMDRLAGRHHTSAVTIAANIMKRKAHLLKLTEIHTIAKKIEEGIPLDSNDMPLLVATWLCARSKRTVLGQRAYRKIKTVFTRFNLCKLPSHYNLTTFWRQTLLTPIQLSMEGTSEVNLYDNRSQYIFMVALF